MGYVAFLAIAGLTTKPKPADVAIVFGNKVELTGIPSPRLKARLDAAKQLYTSEIVKKIIVSGGTGKEGFDEAEVMKIYLIEQGIPPRVIHADRHGQNTVMTCTNARAYMVTHSYKRANVVTQFFHIPRAKFSCRSTGIEIVGGLAPRFFEARDIYSFFREMVAFPVYIFKTLNK